MALPPLFSASRSSVYLIRAECLTRVSWCINRNGIFLSKMYTFRNFLASALFATLSCIVYSVAYSSEYSCYPIIANSFVQRSARKIVNWWLGNYRVTTVLLIVCTIKPEFTAQKAAKTWYPADWSCRLFNQGHILVELFHRKWRKLQSLLNVINERLFCQKLRVSYWFSERSDKGWT